MHKFIKNKFYLFCSILSHIFSLKLLYIDFYSHHSRNYIVFIIFQTAICYGRLKFHSNHWHPELFAPIFQGYSLPLYDELSGIYYIIFDIFPLSSQSPSITGQALLKKTMTQLIFSERFKINQARNQRWKVGEMHDFDVTSSSR